MIQVHRTQVTSGFVNCTKEFRLYPKNIREPFKGRKYGRDIVKFGFRNLVLAEVFKMAWKEGNSGNSPSKWKDSAALTQVNNEDF